MSRNFINKKLRMRWSKKEKDILITYPTTWDGSLLHNFFNARRYDKFTNKYDKSLIEELEIRGYDITTLKFSIDKKK